MLNFRIWVGIAVLVSICYIVAGILAHVYGSRYVESDESTSRPVVSPVVMFLFGGQGVIVNLVLVFAICMIPFAVDALERRRVQLMFIAQNLIRTGQEAIVNSKKIIRTLESLT